MALATTMNAAILGSPLVKVSNSKLFVPINYRQRLGRTSFAPIRCSAEMQEEKKVEQNVVMKGVAPQDVAPPSPPPNPKMSTKFSDVLAFSGPAPERINGRLAMLGFVAAMGVELSKGQDLFSQVSDGGITWFVGSAVLLSLASLIPLFKGVSVESKSDGFMTSDAELWNGRFAMLGLVALAFTEYVKGGTLI